MDSVGEERAERAGWGVGERWGWSGERGVHRKASDWWARVIGLVE
jgi:hypothetical protein